MSAYDEEQDELGRYGAAPELCDRCAESLTGLCPLHRSLEEMREFRAEQDRAREAAN